MTKLIVLLVAALCFSGPASAETNLLSSTLEDQATMMEVAKGLVMASAASDEVGMAISKATVALDIARAEGDTKMAGDIEELLLAYRVVALMNMAEVAARKGDELAARDITILACKKLDEVNAKLAYFVRNVKGVCDPI